MNDSKPLVSIGMPVYNGERYLALALDSLLAQDMYDFELIISDNASTDSTRRICEQYAAGDSRIRYHRNDANIGAAKNFHRAFELSSGKYFMWAAHDDLWEPNYISYCVAALEENPSAVCCYTGVRFIDENGDLLDKPDDGADCLESPESSLNKRVRALLLRWWSFAVYGLMVAETLKKSHFTKGYPNSDVALLFELCLMGRFVRVPRVLFSYRLIETKTVATMMVDVNPLHSSRDAAYAYTLFLWDALARLWRSDISLMKKVSLSYEVITSYCLRHHWRRDILGRENVQEVIRSYKERKPKRLMLALPLSALALPKCMRDKREEVTGKMIVHYRRKNVIRLLMLLPVYILIAPDNLFRKDAWKALARFCKTGILRS